MINEVNEMHAVNSFREGGELSEFTEKELNEMSEKIVSAINELIEFPTEDSLEKIMKCNEESENGINEWINELALVKRENEEDTVKSYKKVTADEINNLMDDLGIQEYPDNPPSIS